MGHLLEFCKNIVSHVLLTLSYVNNPKAHYKQCRRKEDKSALMWPLNQKETTFHLLFSILVEIPDLYSLPTTHFSKNKQTKKNLFSQTVKSSRKFLRSVVNSPCCCSCSALWESVVWYNSRQGRTLQGLERHELLLYIVFVNARWETFACCPAQKNKKQNRKKNLKVTSILFCSYCLYVWVLSLCVWVYLTIIVQM